MQTGLLIAILAGLGVMLGWGVADFSAKKTIDQIGDIPALVWAHICGSLLAVISLGIYLATAGNALPHTMLTWLGLAGFGVLQGTVYLLVYRAFAKGKVSILNPIFASYAGITALAVVIFFGEPLGWLRGAALVLIFGSVLVLSAEDEPASWRKLRFGTTAGLGEIILATIIAAGWTVGWDRFVHGHNWFVYADLMYIFMAAAIGLLAVVQRTDLRVKNHRIWPFLALIGLGEVGAYVSISLGFGRTSHAAVVVLLGGAFSVPALILARLFLGERINRYQFGGIVAIIMGVILIAVA